VLKIGFAIYDNLENYSGSSLYMRKLVDFFHIQGDQVTMVTMPVQNYFFRLSNAYINSFLERFYQYDFDFLIIDELTHPSLDWMNRRFIKPTTYPVISMIHQLRTSEPHPKSIKWIYRQFEKKYILSVDGFIYNSQATKHAVEAVAGKKLKGVVAFPSGDRLPHQLGVHQIVQRAHQEILNIIFVGSIIPRKGLHILMKALARITNKNWFLNIVGNMRLDPTYAQDIMRFVETHQLTNHIKFHGKLSDEKLEELLNLSHVLAVPSTYEGFGIVYLEAMGFGVVPIGTKAGGAREIIFSGQDGYLISADQAQEDLAKKLEALLNDRNRLAAMGVASFHKYKQYPTWYETCERIRAFLANWKDEGNHFD
jgi:glycosyltransferase involved in cell wall biosynthesis